MRHEIDGDLPGDHLLLSLGIEANVACDHLANEPSTNQLTDSSARHCSIVGNYGETALSLAHEFIDQALGRADAHKPSDHEARAIWNHSDGVLKGDGFHARLPTLVLSLQSFTREFRPPFFFEGSDSLRIVIAVIDDAPQSLDTLKASRAHRVSACEHPQLLFHNRN